MNQTTDKLHPFEEAGLGLAPFRLIGWDRKVGPIALGDGMTTIGSPGQPMGSCAFCGQGIAICCRIKSSDGKVFDVGCDCVKKIDREDNRLATAAQKVRSEVAKQQRQEQARIRREQRQAAFEAGQQVQRDRNGGLTDFELEESRKAAERAKVAAAATEANAEILAVLGSLSYRSGFVSDIQDSLRKMLASHMSDRCLSAMCDIFAKQISGGSRRNSKAFKTAEDRFWAIIDSQEETSRK